MVPQENSANHIQNLNKHSSVIEKIKIEKTKRKTEHEDVLNNQEMDSLINPILFVRGVEADSFYLILSGKVMVCSGNEGFLLEQGSFNYMGIECL